MTASVPHREQPATTLAGAAVAGAVVTGAGGPSGGPSVGPSGAAVGSAALAAQLRPVLANRVIGLAVTGGIAAYKAAALCSLLAQAGATVRVAMTESATRFVTPLTFQALSGHPVATSLWEGHQQQQAPTINRAVSMDHLDLTNGASLLIVAPATADILAKFAHGLADDLVSTLYLATVCPVLVAPAMNSRMWLHPATKSNVATLTARSVHIVGPGSGWLAEREQGSGRMAEPADIAAAASRILQSAAHV